MSILKQALAGSLARHDDKPHGCDSFHNFIKSLRVTSAGNPKGEMAWIEGENVLGVSCPDGTILVNEHNCEPIEIARRYQEISRRRDEAARWDRKVDCSVPFMHYLESAKKPESQSGGLKSTADRPREQASLIF